MTIENNVHTLKEQIKEVQTKSARPSDTDVTLICVSKYHTVAEAQQVYDTGIRHFAENRPEGLFEKKSQLSADIVWHYIGSLQTRKVKDVINEITYFHALDRLKLAEEIQKRAKGVIKCFVQVNVSGEESKHGIKPSELFAFVDELKAYDKIQIIGLMTMAPIDASLTDCQTYFEQLRQYRDQLQEYTNDTHFCKELSMGMSRDFIPAIQAGATFIRVGTAFFVD